MPYSIAADALVVFHFMFILFVIFGGFLAWRWRWLVWLHLPAASWATGAVTMRWICPLTPLENSLRRAGGGDTYAESFIEHYLLPVIYPTGLDSRVFVLMGVGIVLINLLAYGMMFYRRAARHNTGNR